VALTLKLDALMEISFNNSHGFEILGWLLFNSERFSMTYHFYTRFFAMLGEVADISLQ
jgi:hypothetical protein